MTETWRSACTRHLLPGYHPHFKPGRVETGGGSATPPSPSSNEWDNLAAFRFEQASNPFPMIGEYKVQMIENQESVLPNGERLRVTAAFTEDNQGVTMAVTDPETTLLNVTAFGKDVSGYDPAVVFYTHRGLHVQLMVGP